MNSSDKKSEEPIEFIDHFVKIVKTTAPAKFQARMVKTIQDDVNFKSYLAQDHIVLPEQYISLINNINGFIMICDYTTGTNFAFSRGLL